MPECHARTCQPCEGGAMWHLSYRVPHLQHVRGERVERLQLARLRVFERDFQFAQECVVVGDGGGVRAACGDRRDPRFGPRAGRSHLAEARGEPVLLAAHVTIPLERRAEHGAEEEARRRGSGDPARRHARAGAVVAGGAESAARALTGKADDAGRASDVIETTRDRVLLRLQPLGGEQGVGFRVRFGAESVHEAT